ncbi:prepilin-type N-terminal cleavage/methylation domain-containing protein [Candidatus Stoquefichus massiliensis]|uniref:prepilin-type N-terminal cleavage/methylation domain-containing protein n=1 Tax=Candidatus Stoquefichus massiliensis TaxID=1470350 RepID=UPI0004AEE6DF|nr:prepilin-type N-terminal cleavage/methylation domain-containing protein [Candidatus Stoquefichus massiliensis]
MNKLSKKGFTLIEIIVVVVILAVLLAIAVPSVLNYLEEADNAKCIAEAKSILTGSEKYLTHQYASKRLENPSFTGYLTQDEKTDIVNDVNGNGTLTSLYYKDGVIQTFTYYVNDKYVVFLGYNKQFIIKDTVYENIAEAIMLDTKIRSLMDKFMSDRHNVVGLHIDSEAGEKNVNGVGSQINKALENLGFDLSNASWQIKILNPNTSGDKSGVTRYQFLISDVKITSEMAGQSVDAMKYIYYADNTKDENKFGNEDNYGAQVKCSIEMHTEKNVTYPILKK